MIKNIPNKYTVQLLAEELDQEMANSYDFLYLPCDIKVGRSLLRITVMLAMGSLTCSTARHSVGSINVSTVGDGASSEVKR